MANKDFRGSNHLEIILKTNQSYYLGIDGGGSKCRAVLTDADGKVLGEGLGGAANPLRGVDRTIVSIEDAMTMALNNAGLGKTAWANTIAGIGLAGLNLPAMQEAMNDWLHPFAQCFFTSDLDIACYGAHGENYGAVVIIGTGSCGVVKQGEETHYLGGHGFLLGDKGSGAWFGAAAMKAVLESSDKLQPQTLLTEKLLKVSGYHSTFQFVEQFNHAKPNQFAKFAPAVFEVAALGDEVAQNIVEEGCAYIDAMCKEMLTLKPKRLALMGGLSHLIEKGLSEPVREQLCQPKHSPEWGGILFAKDQMQSQLSAQKVV